MDLNQIRAELHRLASMADGWRRPQDIAPIERDLMLARLRDLYESVAFGPAAAGDAALARTASAQAPMPAETVARPETACGVTAAAAESPRAAAQPEPQPAAAASPSDGMAEPTAASETEVSAAAEQPIAPAAAEPAAPAAETKSTARTLFGEDEARMRHRRKQRVIMSLYDAPPVPSAAGSTEEQLRNSEPIDLEQFKIGSIDRLLADDPVAKNPQPDETPAAESPAETIPDGGVEVPLVDAAPADEVAAAVQSERAEAPEQPAEQPCADEQAAAPSEVGETVTEPQPAAEAETLSEPIVAAVSFAEVSAEPIAESSADTQKVSADTEPSPIDPMPESTETEQPANGPHPAEPMEAEEHPAAAQTCEPAETETPASAQACEPAETETPATVQTRESAEADAPASAQTCEPTEAGPSEPLSAPAEQPAAVRHPETSETSEAASAAPESPASASVRPSESAPVLGEVIAPHVQTLADTLAAPQETAADRLRHGPIADLRHAVGINDKFLLIRDLFDGNGALYEITIRRLDEFDNFDDCMIYIAEHFAWNPDTDGAKLMMELLERKFT